MRLKSLQLYGFKTFADTTELVFDGNITAIVGPNGSGKSNCADALLWVLAERRLSALRAGESTDVIFAGAAGRRPVGYAEVTLTIDNSAGELPLDYAEVAISRRIQRDGATTYRLNGRRCRRKDIIDLFLDTGVGREAFSIISQREVDAILSLDAAERRRLLEEVAGIERYRTRRDETMRRLAETDENLTRVGDLTLGLSMQVEPLREQREAAQRFLALRDRAEALKLGLQVKEWELLVRRLDRNNEELADLEQAITAARTLVSTAEAGEQQARQALQRADEQLVEARERQNAAEREAERRETRAKVLQERLDNLDQRLADAATAGQRHAATAGRLDAELTEARDQAAVLTARLAAADEALARLDRELTAARAAETTAVAALGQRTAERRAAEQAVDRLEQQVTSSDETLARLDRRSGELADRESSLAAALDGATATLASSKAAWEAARDNHQAMTARYAELSRELAEVERQREQNRDELNAVQARLAERAGRLRLLEEAQNQYDGLYRGVQTVLRAVDGGRLTSDFWLVADELDVAEGCDTAIEAALGPRLQDLVCQRGEDARQAIDLLKRERAGRATFLPLDLISAPEPPRGLDRLRSMVGVVGHALDLVTCDPELDLVRRHLLANVVVTEDLDAGLAVRRAGFDRLTIVTLDGDQIRPSGAMSGGSKEQRGPNLLQRKRELEMLVEAVEALQEELAERTAGERDLFEQRGGLKESLTALQAEIETARRQAGEAERARLAAEAAVEAERLALERLAVDRTAAAAERAELADRRAAAADALAVAAGRCQSLGVDLAELEQAAAEASTKRQRVETERSQVAMERVRLESGLQAATERVASREEAQRSAAEELARLEREAASWRASRSHLDEELSQLARELQRDQTAASQGQAAVAALKAMRADAARAVDEAQVAARQARGDQTTAEQAFHRAELRRIAADTELAALRRHLAEEHQGLTPEEAAARCEAVESRAEATAELEALRADMDALGEVNLGAVEEYERVCERLRFYEEQREDLETAKTDLLLVIDEIDEVTEVRLQEAFAAVNREFLALFRRVMGDDGEARLEWDEPERPLESGLQVVVRMPGKRAQRITLLSGGERAMTTICLLLAMFRVKPSPFCLLDELDAALDDANIRKYRELLQEFTEQSQFIVITHNPETTRAADVLYGITMEEPGVSRAYSHRPPVEPVEPEAAARAAD